jgi:hypothetical protein
VNDPWFVQEVSSDLISDPPQQISIEKQMPKAAKKEKAKNGKAKTKKTRVGQVKPASRGSGKASFKVKRGFNRNALSPMAVGAILRRKPKSAGSTDAVPASPSDEPPSDEPLQGYEPGALALYQKQVRAVKAALGAKAAKAQLAASVIAPVPLPAPVPLSVPATAQPAPAPAPASAPSTLKELKAKMVGLGMPSEVLPVGMGKGTKSYTVRHPKHAASVQVLHDKGYFYLNYDRNGVFPPNRSVCWSHYNTITEAWEFAKLGMEWDVAVTPERK